MAFRADAIEAFVDRRAGLLLRGSRCAPAADATPLPVFDRHFTTLVPDQASNLFRINAVSSAFRDIGVVDVKWQIRDLYIAGGDRARIGVWLEHLNCDGDAVGRSELVYFVDRFRDMPKLAMLEIAACPAWALASRRLVKASRYLN